MFRVRTVITIFLSISFLVLLFSPCLSAEKAREDQRRRFNLLEQEMQQKGQKPKPEGDNKCIITFSPTSLSINAEGGQGATNVHAEGTCRWTATSNDPDWLTITSGGSGTGDDTIKLEADPNNHTSARTGTISIAGSLLTVDQPAGCSAEVTPLEASYPGDGGTGNLEVTAPDGCGWTITSGIYWITIGAGASGSGKRTVQYTVEENPGINSRHDSISAAGKTVNVFQEAHCLFALHPGDNVFNSAGGRGSFRVTTQHGCHWTVTNNAPDMIEVLSSSTGTGDGTVNYRVTGWEGWVIRTGTLKVGDFTFKVRQSSICRYGVNAPDLLPNYPATGGDYQITVSLYDPDQHLIPNECLWTAESHNLDWISIGSGGSGGSGNSGNGNGTVTFSVQPNLGAWGRSGMITVANKDIHISQDSCYPKVIYSNRTFDISGGRDSINVGDIHNYDICKWTVESDSDWITVNPPGTGQGNAEVSFTVSHNETGQVRRGRLTTTMHTHKFISEIEQRGLCTYNLSPHEIGFSYQAGAGNLSVVTPDTCRWTATTHTESSDWLTINSNPSGIGNGTIGYSLTQNASSVARDGHIQVDYARSNIHQAAQPAPTCHYSLSATEVHHLSDGGIDYITVTTTPNCTWNTITDHEWIVITSGSGTGSGRIAYRVMKNNEHGVKHLNSRRGTINIADIDVKIIQEPSPCTYELHPREKTFNPIGGSGEVIATLDSTHFTGCNAYCDHYSALSNNDWIRLTSHYAGPSTKYSVPANTAANSRVGTITINENTFTVTQHGACNVSISPGSAELTAEGGTRTIMVTNPTRCRWYALSETNWILVTRGETRTTDGSVEIRILNNMDYSARNGSVTIGDERFNVMQSVVPCHFILNPTERTHSYSGGTGRVEVSGSVSNAPIEVCHNWNPVSDSRWLTIPTKTADNFNYAVSPNPERSNRTGKITVGDALFTITQEAKPCEYGISPLEKTFPREGGSGQIEITVIPDGLNTEGCIGWRGNSLDDWIIVNEVMPDSTRTGHLNYTVKPIPEGVTERTGTIMVVGKIFKVKQVNTACTYTFLPEGGTVSADGGEGEVTVNTEGMCGWWAKSDVPWLGITSHNCTQLKVPAPATGLSPEVSRIRNASMVPQARCLGSGKVRYSAEAFDGKIRIGTLTIAEKQYKVTQSSDWRSGGQPCTSLSISPLNASFSHEGGQGNINLTSAEGCTWQAASDSEWISVISAGSGWTVRYTVAPNPDKDQRSGVITVAGQTFRVVQAGRPCEAILSPESKSFNARGGTGTIAVSAPGGCEWKAISRSNWISITSGITGNGNGTVGYTVKRNEGLRSREGKIEIGGKTFRVIQAGR